MKNKNIFWLVVIIFLVGVFIIRTVFVSYQATASGGGWHWDLDFWYVAGKMWLEGQSPYDPAAFSQVIADLRQYEVVGKENFSYPPHFFTFFLILQAFPIGVDAWLIYFLNLGLIFLLVLMIGLLLSLYKKIDLPELALLALLLSTGIRTNIKFNQLGLIIGIAIFTSFWFYLKERPVISGVALGVVAFKPTSFPLLALYYFLKKRYWLLTVSGVVILLFGLLPFLFTDLPVGQTYIDFLTSLKFQASGIDSTSPFVATSAAQYQLEILVYRILNTDEGVASIISWMVIVGMVLLIVWLVVKRAPMPRPELYGFALFSSMTMMFIYHRSYEIYLMFPAIIYLYLYALDIQRGPLKNALFVVGWGLLLVDVLPSTLSVMALDYIPSLEKHYLFRLAAPIKVWMLVIAFVSLVLINFFNKKINQTNVDGDAPALAMEEV
ncbi:DUF2029 domain-containing protein [bacterium]|nr:DUF2029 domain-containing protein [bacterium]MCB2180380.1 DUF2029 domain-containing protein [bacterium]